VKSKLKRAELDKLVGLFHANTAELGQFNPVPADSMPEPQRSLLNHERHMTVTVEKFHSAPVSVEVLQEQQTRQAYSREICLRRASDRKIVQYGIVLLDFRHLDPPIQDEIEGHAKPLGRILIEHQVLRQVKLLALYEIEPTELLKSKIAADADLLYGRTAIIYCDHEPAIELLEIVV